MSDSGRPAKLEANETEFVETRTLDADRLNIIYGIDPTPWVGIDGGSKEVRRTDREFLKDDSN